ncbi:MAG: hypothetical protein KJZ78_04085 [Bryobacteraceae bacterium]|nr:hypothetical protein [Bryobacteraceae bacterium]
MTFDFSKFRPAAFSFQDQMTRLGQALRPDYMDAVSRMADLQNSMRLASGMWVEEALGAQRSLTQLMSQLQAGAGWMGDQQKAHRSWTEQFRDISQNIEVARGALLPSMQLLAAQAGQAASVFRNIAYGDIGEIAKHRFSHMSHFQDACFQFATRFHDFTQSLQTPAIYMAIPEQPMLDAGRDLVLAGHAVAVITLDVDEDDGTDNTFADIEENLSREVSFCESLLLRVDPELPRLYLGAREALYGSRSDRARHVLISLRELWSHLLRMLAPDPNVLSWVDGKKELLHEGRPTRNARVLYLCREINYGSFSELVVADTKALIKMLDIFNRVHELNLELSEKQLRVLLFRTEYWLLQILHLAEGNIRNGHIN